MGEAIVNEPLPDHGEFATWDHGPPNRTLQGEDAILNYRSSALPLSIVQCTTTIGRRGGANTVMIVLMFLMSARTCKNV